ncbi:hypothetical protein ACGFIV_19625 [Sphaerisporangium sp. NPDC049003]|uniref:hypothetical protein n=1 Tax=Sphaerisporangium sp. NPDC049003 TaxID=3364517 RepID=UPI003714FEC1
MKGYSYTTITMEPDEAPRVGMHVYPDEHARVSYFPARDTPASFVSVDFADSHLSIGLTAETTVTDMHVKFARGLLEAAAGFLADCERLRDEHATRIEHNTTEQASPAKVA